MTKPLNEQVVVITGASSGIGREAAIQFGKAGATVVLAARNEHALLETAIEIEKDGGRALAVPTDVTSWEQMQNLARTAVDNFGRIDTWVNDAGISVYATSDETTMDEARQVVDVNFMGVVHGVQAALPHMKKQGEGTIINIGSVESARALPLQAVYAASKHAVKGYTESLRMEEMHAKSGINVVLIMPSGINTPLFEHARSKIGVKPQPVPPAYQPELAAQAIVNAAAQPQRDIYVGGYGWFWSMLQKVNPGLLDRLMTMRGNMWRMQESDQPDSGRDNLFAPMPGPGRVHGEFDKMTKRSMYTPILEFAPRIVRRILTFAPIAAIGMLMFSKRRAAAHQQAATPPLRRRLEKMFSR